MLTIGIVLGTTRPGRRGAAVADWVVEVAATRDDARYELVDLADFDLPHLDEARPATFGEYRGAHTITWAERIGALDGFVFVTPEYNHSTTGVLKNALDYLFAEWVDKAAGFVSYGGVGGVRAVEHLRLVVSELGMADVRAQVALQFATEWQDNLTAFRPGDYNVTALHAMLDQVVRWSEALGPLRTDRTCGTR